MDDTERFQCEVLKRTLEQHGYLVLKRHTEPPVEDGEYICLYAENEEFEEERIICDREGIAAILETTGTRLVECFGPIPSEPTP